MMLRFAAGPALLAGLTITPAVAADSLVVPHELWDRPRSGRAVLEQPAIRKAMESYRSQPAARLVIHHAASQEGLLQAEELRAWLVALAVESGRTMLRGSLKPSEPIHLEVVNTP